MSNQESTCWSVVLAAAAGHSAERDELARRYLGIVRSYLATRWRDSEFRCDIDDAIQEVFVECFRQGGVLTTAANGSVPSFRPFLYGVVRNIARRFESRKARPVEIPPEFQPDEASLSMLFDRSWAQAIMVEAAQLQRQRAAAEGAAAVRRVELLRLRFEENLPIRTVAATWGIPAAELHHAYALARKEFRDALQEVVSFHQPGSPAEVEQEAASLLKLLS